MATKTIKAPVIAQTSGTALGNIFNGGSDYRTVKNSMDIGYLFFDNSSFQNLPKACSITKTNLSFKLWGQNENNFPADCDCTVSLDYNLFTVSGKDGTNYSGTAGTYLFSKTFTYGETGNKENFKSQSYDWDSQYNNLFSNSNLYPSLHVSMSESNTWTKALVWMKEMYITFTYLERYYANFYVDGALYDWRAIETGSTFTITPPTKQYYNFVGWQSSEDGKTYTTLPARNSTTEVNYTAVWEEIIYTITWDYDGGVCDGKTSTTTQQAARYSSASGYERRIPKKAGYSFVGWDRAQPGGFITQDGYKGYTNNYSSGWQVSINSDYSTKYKLNFSGITGDDWRWIHFGEFTVTPLSTVTITGQIRIISLPLGIKFYHGSTHNDWNNVKATYNSSDADGQWKRFSITRTGYPSNLHTACFDIYTDNLINASGTIEFDLREIHITVDNVSSESACRVSRSPITSDLTIKALYRPATYVSYDTMLNYLKWKDIDLTTTSCSGGQISGISDTGFTLTATSGDAYTWPFSPMYYTETDNYYTISFLGIPTNTSGNYNIFSFYYNADGKTGYDYTLGPDAANFSNTRICDYTFKAKSPYGRIRVGSTTNGQQVQFADFRMYPTDAKYSYMKDSLGSFYRNYRESWGANNTMPIPTRTGYTFTSWNTKPDGSGATYTSSNLFPTKDIILFSQWTINKYTATFYDYQGNIIETKSVDYNTTPTCSKQPTKPSTAEYDYEFIGWQNIGPITGDTSYYPEYKSIRRSYTITWIDGDNNKIYSEEMLYGSIPMYNQNQYGIPNKTETAEYKWDWQGWTRTPTAVTDVATYYAYHAPIKQKYLITWINDNESFLSDEIVEYGKTPKIPEDPISEFAADDKIYDYQFIGWDATPGDNIISGVGEVIGVTIYQAVYSMHLKSFNLIVNANPNLDEATIGTGTYIYNTIVDIHAIPPPGYLFHQWSDGVKTPQRAITVTQNATYTAEFKKILCYWNTTPITEAYLNTTQITI